MSKNLDSPMATSGRVTQRGVRLALLEVPSGLSAIRTLPDWGGVPVILQGPCDGPEKPFH